MALFRTVFLLFMGRCCISVQGFRFKGYQFKEILLVRLKVVSIVKKNEKLKKRLRLVFIGLFFLRLSCLHFETRGLVHVAYLSDTNLLKFLKISNLKKKILLFKFVIYDKK